MKKLLPFYLLLVAQQAFSQPDKFNYDDYFYYRNHQYLQTPNILLSGAQLKIASGDTAAAIELVKHAAGKNMYDTGFITGRSSLRFITKTKHWKEITAIIEKTRIRYSDPSNMEIITSDIDHFWELYDRINSKDADELFMQEYILKGSQGLRTFFEVRMNLRATNLVSTVRSKNKYYESIRPVSLALKNYKPQIVAAAKKLKALYDNAIFPPTSFVMANFNAFGTADGGGGQLIGVEFLCNPATADTSQLGSWEKTNLTDTSRILGIVLHELIHIEQNTVNDNTLLGRSINEGAADFISQLVLGYNLNKKIHDYGNIHEKELWEKFSRQMHKEDVSEWLYNGFDAKRGYPQDLGYYIGYKICEAYYQKAADKKQAVKDILEIQDFKKFLEKSGYPYSQ
ncbi:MAG: hypothetical protein J0L56_13655 [Chitinophagales bacterium]|nr:hypothetical protein [Chitinophagales bacterium]